MSTTQVFGTAANQVIAQALANPAVADQECRRLVDEIHAQGMYVVLDIVLNHAGDLFNYEGALDSIVWKGDGPEYTIYWRDSNNDAQGTWTDVGQIPSLPGTAGVWPAELQRNDCFRRRGDVEKSPDKTRGDFGYSPYLGGVLAYSRVLNDQEVVILANASKSNSASVGVVVDRQLHPPGATLAVLFSNLTFHGAAAPTAPGATQLASGRSVVPVVLRPMEALALG